MMDSPGNPLNSPQTQGRNASTDNRRRVPITRKTTRGPLDGAKTDPLSRPTSSSQSIPDHPIIAQSPQSSRPSSAIAAHHQHQQSQSRLHFAPESQSGHPRPPPRIDISFLTRPSLYRSIPTTHIPPPILRSRHQPSPSTDLPTLLEKGHYRHAATKASQLLTSTSLTPDDTDRILELYQTRLACRILVSHPEIAIQEARPLLDWIAHHETRTPGGPASPARGAGNVYVAQIPWDLRVLLHRLQTLASGDGRRSVMMLYSLANEARLAAAAAGGAMMTTTTIASSDGSAHGTGPGPADRSDTANERDLWTSRLEEIGYLVVTELLEMGELETARRTLDSFASTSPDPALLCRRALLHIRMNDITGAESCLFLLQQCASEPALETHSPSSSLSLNAKILESLIHISKKEYKSAVDILAALHAEYPSNELVANNLAVAHLYAGHIEVAAEFAALSSGVKGGESGGHTFKILLMNLGCIYELTSDVRESNLAKQALVQSVAETGPRGHGEVFEREIVDFEL